MHLLALCACSTQGHLPAMCSELTLVCLLVMCHLLAPVLGAWTRSACQQGTIYQSTQ